MKRSTVFLAALFAMTGLSSVASGSDLDGSRNSMERQHSVAVDLDYSFAQTASQVEQVVADGDLALVEPNADFAMSGVSFPYARPEVYAFIRRLAEEYRIVTGATLVVTSLTRPLSEQPSNASPLSVHPTGMAVDLRIPTSRAARAWLEARLLTMEQAGVLDVTLEQRPPHLHVAVFPAAYDEWAARQDAEVARRVASRTVRILAPASPAGSTQGASADMLFVTLIALTLLSLAAAFARKSAAAFARLRLTRR